jgi:RNA polymerase sigma factor FliA
VPTGVNVFSHNVLSDFVAIVRKRYTVCSMDSRHAEQPGSERRRRVTETERRDWSEYRSTGDVGVRNRLVERHLALVHHFAQRMEPRTGGAVERGDLISAGALGLMSAVSAYDPGRGFRFSTFAARRIRGAMLDEMRRRDVAPRSVRRKQRDVEDARERLAVELDRVPSHPELATELGVDPQTLWRWKWDVDRSRRVSLTDVVAGEDREVAFTGDWTGEESTVEDRLSRDQETSRLRRELGTLSPREQLILRLYDLESNTLREIAGKLGVTESRVSQLRTRALARLRARMADMREAA